MKASIDLHPSMDNDGLSFFNKSLENSSCYLEYGSGGSTYYATTKHKVRAVISVDSDIKYLESVKSKIDHYENEIHLLHCDIGPVGDWGWPIDRSKSDQFWSYPTSPWKTARENNLYPDTVLIDGRFRVACFLYSLIASRPGTLLLFDDYFDRPEYFVVEDFCELGGRHGRLAHFFTSKQFDVKHLTATLMQNVMTPK